MAPGQSRDSDGNLALGGVSAAALAQMYGTPLLVINLDVVDGTLAALARVANDRGVEVSYAAKAFATVPFVRHLAQRSIGLDVCSLGELVTAERAGFPASRITLHGAGKSDEELEAACAGRVGRIVVDGIEELRRLAHCSIATQCRSSVMLRLNVGVEAATHAFIRTAGEDTKFGLHARDESAAMALLAANPQLQFAGLHAHAGSQIFDSAPYLATALVLVNAAARFARTGLRARRLIVGGGFGVTSNPAEVPNSLDIGACIAAACKQTHVAERECGLAAFQLGIEPGRAVVALAGTTLYRVLAVKRQTQRTFVVVDGGIAENPRPALYGARHHVVPAARRRDAMCETATVCGRSCENDELAMASLPRDIASGSILAMCATGAYTYSMAGNYNRFPRPAVVALADGTHRLLARRESIEDVLAKDAPGE